MVVVDSEPARGVGCGSGGTISQSQHSRYLLPANILHHRVSGLLRRFEMYGDGLVSPRIFQLVTSIGDVEELHA
jgi:hypothetical protein